MIRRFCLPDPFPTSAQPTATIWGGEDGGEVMWRGPLSECQEVLYSMVARGVEYSHWNAEPPEGESEPLSGYRL
jgi:hypothetical protein